MARSKLGVVALRRANLDYLVRAYGSQSALAHAANVSSLTQPVVSTILRRKRVLWPDEARAVEANLGIPQHWLDRFEIHQAWRPLLRFRELPPDVRQVFNELAAFAEGAEESGT